MSLPETGPATLERVRAHLQLAPTDTRDDLRLTEIVAAVNSLVRQWPVVAELAEAAEVQPWPAHVVEGATMLTARLWRRKDSPAGVAAFGDLGPVYVQRNDPDVALLLQLGDHARPAVG